MHLNEYIRYTLIKAIYTQQYTGESRDNNDNASIYAYLFPTTKQICEPFT